MMTINGQEEDPIGHRGFTRIERKWRTGDSVDLTFTQRVVARPPVNRANGAEQSEYHTFHYGPMILGCDKSELAKLDRNAKFSRRGERDFIIESKTEMLQPIYHLLDPKQNDGCRRQILFQNP